MTEVLNSAVPGTDERFTEAKEAMGTLIRWEEVAPAGAESTLFLGNVIQGIYQGKKENVGQNNSTIYELLLADGQLVGFWGSNLMDGKMNLVEVGKEVRVTFLGVAQPKTAGGKPYRNFKVESADPVVTMNEVAAPVAPAVQAPVNTQEAPGY